MWIARDENGILNIFADKPTREKANWTGSFIGELSIYGYFAEDPIIDKISGFENLKWENEPLEVVLMDKGNADALEEIQKNIIEQVKDCIKGND